MGLRRTGPAATQSRGFEVVSGAYVILDTLITIAFFAVLMAACWKRVAATQFSLYMAIANMGLSGGAALLGPLRQWLSYPHVFFVVAACALLVVVSIVPYALR